METDPPGLQLALKVASWGWRVAPGFCSRNGEKVPLMGSWNVNATTDPDKLRAAWDGRSWLWTGVVSGVGSCLVLDCDTPESVDWLRALVANQGWNRGGLIYKTPGRGGGLHCVWNWPDFLKSDFRQAKVSLPNGGEVQIRGNGHWTLLCGAKRPDGVYEVLEMPDDVQGPSVAPEGIIRSILRESVVSTGRVVSSDLEELSPEEAWNLAPLNDGRKNAVAGLAWYLAIRGEDLGTVVDICVRFGRECCVPELAAEHCVKKAEYAVQRVEAIFRDDRQKTEELFGLWRRWQ